MSEQIGGNQTALPPAGWYLDPSDPARQKWWDGRAWTEHVQVQAPVLQAARHDSPQPAVTRPSNPIATTGFALGIASFFLFAIPIFGVLLSITAALFSWVGLVLQGPEMATRYKVFGIIGVALGLVYTFMSLIFMFGMSA
ncbi:DUF2510 domain-containing protein [Arthrobacter sp. I2-34]|uniref:DUF2510 domain-containing protein n=1 Tax=Arthrobacter hankyongi TaxID=2904801 RepID=A0ABS9LDT0_9MICC|nr:DUF2510 domain-containing protein [Arthrobacter hankyongi]MCG2624678.1 DUF2510 domain-containing protein [Arthrobacter hankyongi]